MEADEVGCFYEHLPSDGDSYLLSQLSSSCAENGVGFFFTDTPNKIGWNNKNANNMTVVQESVKDEDAFEEHVVGKSYDAFERKLRDGFLEAPNLGLVSAPPAMFDYQPPLQRIDLKDNKIELLPDHFFDELPFLNWCDLRYNRLLSIPKLNIEHKNLKVLLLQDNQLSSLPYTLARAINLLTLGWTNNDISDPPRFILLQGCQCILKYLRDKLAQESSLFETGNNLDTFENDEQLEKDLAKTAKKHTVKRTKSRNSLVSGESTKTSSDQKKEEDDRKRRIDRLKYTWDLWKSIPYNGISNNALFEKSVQEVKDEVKAKLNEHRDAVLQKIKDNDALGKWRWETKMLQMKGPVKSYEGVKMPFGTDADNANDARDGRVVVDANTYRTTMSECMKRLQYLAENPASISDTEKSLERLKEVEDIQRKLFDMKLKWSVKSSNPI